MSLAARAFQELFPDQPLERDLSVYYTDRFKDYNANVRYTRDKMEFRLSLKWKTVSEEIQLGLIQNLLVKVYRVKKKTMEIELYDKFLKNLSEYSPVTRTDPLLEESFQRVNEQYFNGLLNQPNLVWGTASFRKLGHYEYATDTISMSTALQGNPALVDYVMYHEMLHKKHKFRNAGIKSLHHSAAFKKDEARYADHERREQELNHYLRKKRFKKWLFW